MDDKDFVVCLDNLVFGPHERRLANTELAQCLKLKAVGAYEQDI